MAGIRVYFGNHDKMLIRRQREGDPVAHMPRPPHPPNLGDCKKTSAAGSPTEPCGYWVQHATS